jgi:hypothetical protein
MALPDLTGLNIEDTYQRVLQTDGVNIYDGTGSIVNIAATGPFATTGSNTFNGTQLINGDVTINGTASISVLNVSIESSSIIYSSGSNQFGDALNDTQTLWGTVTIPTGSLTVSGSTYSRRVLVGNDSGSFDQNDFYHRATNGGVYFLIRDTNNNNRLYFTGQSGTSQMIAVSQNIGFGIYSPISTNRVTIGGLGATAATTALRVENANASASFVVRDDGAIGIGTATPTALLTVSGSSNPNIVLANTNYSNGGFVLMRNNYTQAHKWWAESNTGYISYSPDQVTYSPIITYQGTTGNVGIGTTPSTKLHISGASSAALLRIESPASSSILVVTGSGRVGINTAAPRATTELVGTLRLTNVGDPSKFNDLATDLNGYMTLQNLTYQTGIGSNSGWVNLFTNFINVGSGSGYFFTSTANSGTSTRDVGFSRAGINMVAVNDGAAGNANGTLLAANIGVGIGTSTVASASLVVNSTGGTSATNIVQFTGASTQRFNFRSDGVMAWGQNVNSAAYGFLNWDTNKSIIGSVGTNNFTFFTGGSERMFISSSGNIGIRTNSPAYLLDVSGSVRFTGRAHFGTNSSFWLDPGLIASDPVWGGALRIDGGVWLGASGQRVRVGSYVTPTARFEVVGLGSTSATTAMRVDNAGGQTSLAVLDNGYVGIGTTAPISRFSVVDNSGYSPSLNATASVNFNIARGTTFATNLTVAITGSEPFTAAIQHRHATLDGYSYPISLNPLGGNIGIGTNTPAYLLDVNGIARVSGEANVSFLSLSGNTAVNSTGNTMILGASGTWTGVRVPRYFEITGSINASAGFARGTFINQTLVATANNDTLYALDIAPVFTSSSYTGVTFVPIRVRNSTGTGNAFYLDGIGNASLQGSLGVGTIYASNNINLSSGTNNLLLQTNFTANTGLTMFNSTRNIVIQNGGTFVDNGYRLDVSGSTRITNGLNVTGSVDIAGTLTATVKSFIIEHPTKPQMRLQYGVLEGPEHSVYIRGKLTNQTRIELPDYWYALVHEDSITVNLTPIGSAQNLWVNNITSKYIDIASDSDNISCFYTVFAERKDIDKLITEYEN